MLHWYMNPKMINGNELKMPGASRTALYAPSVNPSLMLGLVPCRRTASQKIVSTIKKLTNTEIIEENLSAVSVRGSEIGKVRTF
jgi:hypothetical protein